MIASHLFLSKCFYFAVFELMSFVQCVHLNFIIRTELRTVIVA